MMVACLYHRIGEGAYANSPERMAEHLAYIAKRFRTVLPGDPLRLFQREICLTFDDATYDFYYYAFPWVRKWNLKCLLAVPAGLIPESTIAAPTARLRARREPYSYCTWKELKEISDSGLVEIASHSMHHSNLLDAGVDLDVEISLSKKQIEERLDIPVNTFVYPYGKFDGAVHQKVLAHYKFSMRIGMGINLSWQNWNRLIYRIPCDNLAHIKEPFGMGQTVSSFWFYLLNSVRGR